MYVYRTLLKDDTFETYDNKVLTFDILYDDDFHLLSFIRMHGKSMDSLSKVNKMSLNISLNDFKQFCKDWIQNLKSLTLFQYEDFQDDKGAFVDDIYVKKRDSVEYFPDTVTTISTFKWNKLFSIKYSYNNNIIVDILKKGKSLLTNDSNTRVYFTKIGKPLSEYYSLYYIKKYYLIRKQLQSILDEFKQKGV